MFVTDIVYSISVMSTHFIKISWIDQILAFSPDFKEWLLKNAIFEKNNVSLHSFPTIFQTFTEIHGLAFAVTVLSYRPSIQDTDRVYHGSCSPGN